ncbi:hypothetical protein QCA50_002461 [Cerrena zonata]|uniref:WHIM1 domain-containing protein n=1 Tax=Cerrena zonata TaxID=2478898 RepID=A0AAW0GP68_9APHY
MKSASVADTSEKKGHICPPSNATHPRDRWESLFIYGFICKFTQLRGKVDGLNSPMALEEALLSPEAHPLITQILARFVLNLRPQTRNTTSDVISATVSTIFQEYFKSTEKTVFWNDDLKANIDPFPSLPGTSFWEADWDMRLKIMRQLVELQLCHSGEIKATIDRAWGVIHNKHKKHETTPAPPPPSDPQSMENLQLIPLGQDMQRKRYWVIDDSSRVYLSTNPWKITATFQAISSSREEYVALIEKLRGIGPTEPKSGERRTKVELQHLALLKALEDRLPAIDAEIAKQQRARKKAEQKQLLIAQADLRETRTRKRTTRPDYAYMNDPSSEEDNDEYVQEEQPEVDDDDDMNFQDDEPSTSRRAGRRRSTRTRPNGNTDDDDWNEWRGERRSSRLGATTEMQMDVPPPPKRARTVESNASATSTDLPAQQTNNKAKTRVNGAAALKPTETVVETVAGKKKSKYWFYAVEPVNPLPAAANEQPLPSGSSNGTAPPSTSNGYYSGAEPMVEDTDYPLSTNGEHYENSIGASRSPSHVDMNDS